MDLCLSVPPSPFNDSLSLAIYLSCFADWMRDVYGRVGMVQEGYGSTEAGNIASHGTLSLGVKVRLEDCSDMGYTSQVSIVGG
jgi:hypothetical protein